MCLHLAVSGLLPRSVQPAPGVPLKSQSLTAIEDCCRPAPSQSMAGSEITANTDRDLGSEMVSGRSVSTNRPFACTLGAKAAKAAKARPQRPVSASGNVESESPICHFILRADLLV